jgi:hypothetical protein
MQRRVGIEGSGIGKGRRCGGSEEHGEQGKFDTHHEPFCSTANMGQTTE